MDVYVILKKDNGCYSVGCYNGFDNWCEESEFDTFTEASHQAMYLNSGDVD